jgi:H+/Cl- antiporter ClcA
MLTPVLATGAALGSVLVLTTNSAVGTHFHVSAVSLAGAAGVLAVTERAPTWAAIFVWELARLRFGCCWFSWLPPWARTESDCSSNVVASAPAG